MQLLHPLDRMPYPKCLVLGEADPALFDKEPKASPKRRLAYPGKGSSLRLRGARFKQGALMYRQYGGGRKRRRQTTPANRHFVSAHATVSRQTDCLYSWYVSLFCGTFPAQIV